MISLTTHPAQKSSTAKLSQRQQTETPALAKAQGLQQDTVHIRKQSKEEVFAEAQKLLAQAEASPVPEIKLLGVNKALKKLKTQTANESNKDIQAKQEQSLEALLKRMPRFEKSWIRQALLQIARIIQGPLVRLK